MLAAWSVSTVGRISASHAEGKVISDGSYSGGLVGTNDRGGRIADSPGERCGFGQSLCGRSSRLEQGR